MKTKFNGILTLLLAFVVQFSFAQERTISGTVSDVDGPLPEVSIIIKGTTTGVVSDFDGNYSISAKSGDVLQFNSVGYADVEKTVGVSNTISVVMDSDGAIEDVIVTALGIKRERKEVVYQTESVGSDELLRVQPQQAASALAGKVAGLQINIQNNGVEPSSQILLRGLRSISSSNSALIVIDGSVSTQGAFDQLNPNDIESLNVLKGGTASALYGSRAANGAILVMTKKGKRGDKFTLGVNSTYTMQQVAYMPEFQTEYGTGWQGAYDAIENTNWGPKFDGSIRRIGPIFSDGSFQTAAYAPIEDNLLDFYNDGSNSQTTVYFSGGDDKNSFYVSIGDLRAKGIVPNDEFNKNTLRVNASRKMGDFEISLNSSFYTDKKNLVGEDLGAQDRTLYWYILNTSANIDLKKYKDWGNDFYASPNGFYNGYYGNPYWHIDNARDISNKTRLNGNVNLSWEANDWLNFTARIGINNSQGKGKSWRAAQIFDTTNMIVSASRPSNISSFVNDREFVSTQITTDLIGSADLDLTENLTLKAITGLTSFSSKFDESAYKGNNLTIPGFYDLSNASGQLVGGLSNGAFVDGSRKKTYGVFGDLTFGYNDYLYLNLSGRNDWTSTLDAANNSYFYPTIGVSAVLSDMVPAISEGNFINYMKVTASNSTTYNDINPYRINERFSQALTFPYGGLNGFEVATTAVDDEIKKEKIGTIEFGLNMAFFSNRLTLDAAYYESKTTDLITSVTQGPSAGAHSLLTNIGGIDGSGLEVTLGGTIIKPEDKAGFKWGANVNYTSNQQKVSSIAPGTNEIALSNPTGEVGVFAVVGEYFPQIKGTSYVRDPQGRIVVGSDGDPLQAEGLKNLGKTTPDYIVGFTNSFSYKGFTLASTMDYRTGHVYYSQLADRMEFTGRSMESVSSNRQDFVLPNSVINTGTNANPVYVPNTNLPVNGGRQSYWMNTYNNIKENYVRDATSLKLRELSLSYNLPSDFLKGSALSKLSIGLVGRNLITWLPKENRFSDPEFNNTSTPTGGVSSNAIGIGGYAQAPPTRSYGLNINIEF